MKLIRPRNAGTISVVIAIVVLVAIYTLLGTVDLVFMQNGKEVSRQEDVNVFSTVELPEGDLSYTVDGATKTLGDPFELKTSIGVMVLNNFISLKWQEEDSVISIDIK